MASIGIIGAGAAGLSAAWELVQRGHSPVIFESEDRVGGLAAGRAPG
jgi:protoporphyrinogen oxidase